MLMPSVFGDNLFDELFLYPWDSEAKEKHALSSDQYLMRTDIQETDSGYQVDVELPGFKKEDVSAKVEDGYLTVSAAKNESTEEKDDKSYIRRERFTGNCSRTFYVGKGLKPEDITAKFEDGILQLNIPKPENVKAENNPQILIG